MGRSLQVEVFAALIIFDHVLPINCESLDIISVLFDNLGEVTFFSEDTCGSSQLNCTQSLEATAFVLLFYFDDKISILINLGLNFFEV